MGRQIIRPRLEISLNHVGVRRGTRWVLEDVTLRLTCTDRWALLGENGAGKTQLLKLLATDLWPTPTGRESMRLRLGGRPVDVALAKRRIAYIGAERQDRYARYDWNLTVRDVLITGLHRTDLLLEPASAAQRRRVTRMLRACGLTHLAARPFLSLSYGQKRLTLLARALVQEPDWLLLDEFYNGLDAHYRGRVDRVLAAARKRGQSWIAAAHRPIDVPRGTTKYLEIAGGRLSGGKDLRRGRLARLARPTLEAKSRNRGDAGRPAAPTPTPTPTPRPRPRPRPSAAGACCCGCATPIFTSITNSCCAI